MSICTVKPQLTGHQFTLQTLITGPLVSAAVDCQNLSDLLSFGFYSSESKVGVQFSLDLRYYKCTRQT